MERDVSAAVKAGAHGVVIGVSESSLLALLASSLPSSIYQLRLFCTEGVVLLFCKHLLQPAGTPLELAQETIGVILKPIDSFVGQHCLCERFGKRDKEKRIHQYSAVYWIGYTRRE